MPPVEDRSCEEHRRLRLAPAGRPVGVVSAAVTPGETSRTRDTPGTPRFATISRRPQVVSASTSAAFRAERRASQARRTCSPAKPFGMDHEREVVHREDDGHGHRQRCRVCTVKQDVDRASPDGARQRELFPARAAPVRENADLEVGGSATAGASGAKAGIDATAPPAGQPTLKAGRSGIGPRPLACRRAPARQFR